MLRAKGLLFVLLFLSSHASAEPEWPQFRGPHGDGTSPATGLPTHWSETENLRWKVPLYGRGRSSPVIAGNRIWLTTARTSEATPQDARARLAGHPDASKVDIARRVVLHLVAFDRAKGTRTAQVELFRVERPDPIHKLNSFATPTPIVDGQSVYCDFGTLGTACVDAATAQVLWKSRLPVDHVLGPASSPVLYEDLLLVVRDGCDAQYVAALCKRTGRVVWKTNQPAIDAASRYEKKAYSTPLLIEVAGHAQLVLAAAQWICAYDPRSGREIWRVHHGKGFSLAPRPVFGHGLVYVATGCYTPELWSIRPDGSGDVTDTHVAWRARGSIPTMSSPLLHKDNIFCVSDGGILSCFDAHSGAKRWRERLGGEYLASPLSADGKFYFFGYGGQTTVFAAGNEPLRLAENRLEGPLAASPAIADHSIYLRTDSHLYCIQQADDRSEMIAKVASESSPTRGTAPASASTAAPATPLAPLPLSLGASRKSGNR